MSGLKPTSPIKPLSDLLRNPAIATAAVAAAGVLISSALLARTAFIPYSAGVVSAALPRLWGAVARPYLFATVHVIIFIIWKLSEHRHRPEEEKPSPDAPVPITLVRKPSPEIPRQISLPGPDPAVSVPEPYSDESKSTETEMSAETAMASAAEPPVLVETVVVEDDSMEARWKAIMHGGAAPVARFTPPPEAGVVVVEPEDWNQRFDAFIKKNYEQIRVAGAGVNRTQ